MYEALTGRAPIIGENVLDTMQRQINEKPVALDTVRPDLFIPEPMQAILYKTLEKDPNARYQSMADLKRDLDVLLDGMSGRPNSVGVKQRDLPGLSKLEQYPEEKKMPYAALLSLAVLSFVVSGLVLVAVWNLLPKKHEPSATEAPNTVATTTTATSASSEISSGTAPHAVPKSFPQVPTDPKKAAALLAAFAKEARANGQLTDADKAVSKAITALRATGHTNDLPAADLFELSGYIGLDMHAFKKADGMLQKALAIEQRELGVSAPRVIDTLNALGRAAEGQQDFARADAYYKQALALKRS